MVDLLDWQAEFLGHTTESSGFALSNAFLLMTLLSSVYWKAQIRALRPCLADEMSRY